MNVDEVDVLTTARVDSTKQHPSPCHPTGIAPDMLALSTVVALLGLLTTSASTTALTYKLAPNEKECFYAHVEDQNAKIAFYFAVQSGGDFDSM